MGRNKRKYVISSWKGIDNVKANAGKANHTTASVQSYSIFGLASNRSKIARQLLNSVLPQPKSIAIRQRLQNAFSKWLQTQPSNDAAPLDQIPFFNGLTLNEKNEWRPFLKFPVSVSRLTHGQLMLHTPAFDPVQQIKAPANTKRVYLKIAVAGLGMENPAQQEAFQTELAIQYIPGILPAQDIRLQLATLPGRLVLVSMALQYFTGNTAEQTASQLPWKPAGIVGSFYN